MSKEALVVFPNNNPPERRFKRSDWPVHATVVPWFKNPRRKRENVYNEFEETLSGMKPFTASVSTRGRTRYNPTRGVSLLENEPWQQMHNELMPKLAHHIGKLAMLPTTIFAKGVSVKGLGKYRPHITDQKSAKLDVGYPFEVNEIHVVRKSKIPGHRKVVRSFSLGKNTSEQPDFGTNFKIPQDSSTVEIGKDFVPDQTLPSTQLLTSIGGPLVAASQLASNTPESHSRKSIGITKLIHRK